MRVSIRFQTFDVLIAKRTIIYKLSVSLQKIEERNPIIELFFLFANLFSHSLKQQGLELAYDRVGVVYQIPVLYPLIGNAF